MSYALPNAWELAERRLELLEASHDADSIRFAEALGIGPDWDCLEAGAGHGSFARWLAGRARSVLAVDLDVRLLEHLEAPNLEVRSLNLATEALPPAAFDLVHTRLVLIHVPERERALRNLVSAVRPGGFLLVEEDDTYPIEATATGDYRRAWDAFVAMTVESGLDPHWARGLPERLGELGLVDVGAEVDDQFFPGGSVPARFWSLTWVQARERIGDVVDGGHAELQDPRRWFHGPAKFSVWGRRPGP
jgi:SAM-dependent methyltransferase